MFVDFIINTNWVKAILTILKSVPCEEEVGLMSREFHLWQAEVGPSL